MSPSPARGDPEHRARSMSGKLWPKKMKRKRCLGASTWASPSQFIIQPYSAGPTGTAHHAVLCVPQNQTQLVGLCYCHSDSGLCTAKPAQPCFYCFAYFAYLFLSIINGLAFFMQLLNCICFQHTKLYLLGIRKTISFLFTS